MYILHTYICTYIHMYVCTCMWRFVWLLLVIVYISEFFEQVYEDKLLMEVDVLFVIDIAIGRQKK